MTLGEYLDANNMNMKLKFSRGGFMLNHACLEWLKDCEEIIKDQTIQLNHMPFNYNGMYQSEVHAE